LVEGLIRLMETGDEVIGPVNIGNPDEFTINDLAKKVLKYTDSKSKIAFLPLPQDDPVQRKPDIAKAITILGGWRPSIHLDYGLQNTINYYKSSNR